jgi:hypothetical protein
MQLAHVRNGEVIRRYSGAKGWVDLADGRKVSPPVLGFKDGPDEIVDAATLPTPEAPVPTLEERRAVAAMHRPAFAIAAAKAGWVTEDEALAWVAGNAIPAVAQQVIDTLPADKQLAAKVAVLSDEVVPRMSALILGMQQALQVKDADLDAVFGIK